MQQSVQVMKNMVLFSVSQVCFARNLFEESDFHPQKFGDLECQLLQNTDSVSDNAKEIQSWIHSGIYKALEDGYLSGLHLFVFTVDGDTGERQEVEHYEFRISRDPSGLSIGFGKKEFATNSSAVKKMAVSVVRKLVMTCGLLQKLPVDRFLGMRVVYSKDCPVEYNVNHFQNESEEEQIKKNHALKKLAVGTISTGYHEMVLKVRARFKEPEESSEEEDESSEEEASEGEEREDSSGNEEADKSEDAQHPFPSGDVKAQKVKVALGYTEVK